MAQQQNTFTADTHYFPHIFFHFSRVIASGVNKHFLFQFLIYIVTAKKDENE